MQKTAKALSLTLALTLVLTLFPATAQAANATVTTVFTNRPNCSYIRSFSEGRAVIENNFHKYGYINAYGSPAISFKYDTAASFQDGLALVERDGRRFLINTNGNEIVSFPENYNFRGGFSEGLAVVQDLATKKYGYTDTAGELAIPFMLDYALASDFHEGLALVINSSEQFGFIDKSGELAIPFSALSEYGYVGNFSDGRALVTSDTGFGFIDKTGELVIPCKYQSAIDFADGRAAVSEPGTNVGFIDTEGNLVIPYRYMFVSTTHFHEGLASVAEAAASGEEAYWGYIDREGSTVVPFIYDFTDEFHDGYAVVQKDNKCGLIDTRGNLVVPCQYDLMENYAEGLLPVATGSYPNWKWSLLRIPEESGEMESDDQRTVRWSYQGVTGMLRITGDVSASQPLFVACLDERGRMLSVSEITGSGEWAGIPQEADQTKLMWVDRQLCPNCESTSIEHNE